MADKHSSEFGRDQLELLIKNDDKWAIGALLKIYEFQTSQEQEAKNTYEKNKMGFSATDAGFMTSMAQQFINKGRLTERQIPYVKRTMPKYIGQLMDVGFEPIGINKIASASLVKRTAAQNIFEKLTGVKFLHTAELQKNNIVIKFQFPKGDKRFFETVAKVKELPGRRFVKTEFCWKCPVSIEAVDKLSEWKFDISEELLKWRDDIMIKPELNPDLEIPGLKQELYPFQKEGVSFIESRNGRALVADSMGLGKTAQALAWLQLHPELRPVLIVVPCSLKLNWEKEAGIWLSNTKENADIQILSGSPGKTSGNPLHGNIVIINYDILSKWEERLKKYNFKVIICDECHYIKSSGTQRSKAVIKLCKGIEHVIALSGTPIVNRPIEMYNSLKIILPGLFPSRWKFAHKYCGAYHNGFGWNFNGSSNTDELHKLLTESVMIRRKKEDVLKDLPAKTRSIIPLEIENYSQYKAAENNIIEWIRENEGKEKAEKAKQAEVLVQFEKLKQLAVEGKIKQCIDWIENFLESDQKLVVFTTHKKTINLLMNHFGDIAVKLDGSTPADQRQVVVDQFQENPKIKLFIGNVQAAGVGITLVAASNVCFLEFPWTPGAVEQAEDRCHRIGQDNKVNIYYLVANNTIEEDIAEIISKKQKVLTAILDGKEADQNSVLSELIKNVAKNN